MSVQEAYVSYDIAKFLKEKGFNCPCRAYITLDENGHPYVIKVNDVCEEDLTSEQYLCPTHQMVLSWLRSWNLHVEITFVKGNNINPYAKCYYYRIFDMVANEPMSIAKQNYSSYEEAVEAAVKYCLKYLM